MRARTAWLAGAAGAAIAAWKRLRPGSPAARPAGEDPRAEELRRRLDESRTVAEEQHEQAASAETPVDAVDAVGDASVEDRRSAVHERARAAAEEMRGSGSGSGAGSGSGSGSGAGE